jgi:hypothetical protein
MDLPIGACGVLNPAGVDGDDKRSCAARVHRRRQAHEAGADMSTADRIAVVSDATPRLPTLGLLPC